MPHGAPAPPLTSGADMRVKLVLEVLRSPTDPHPRWEHQWRNLMALSSMASA
jgi:hypothetical protein